MEKRPRGKPLKLNRDVIAEIAGYIRAGSSRAGAAKKAGFSKRTLRKWNKKGREGAGGVYGELWLAVVAAEKTRDTKPGQAAPEAEPVPRPEIVEATTLEQTDGNYARIPCQVTYDELKYLQSLSQIYLSTGRTANGAPFEAYKYCPRPEAQLTPSQQNLVDKALNVTLRDHRGQTLNHEYRRR